MIIVTGTKRSGTSLWMQILVASGLPFFGEAFPKTWEKTIKDANPEGFYESIFCGGIYYRTNPHPRNGKWVHPDQVRTYAAKVFIPGLVRSDIAYIDRVIATVRNWREYDASLSRLETIQHESTGRESKRMTMPPGYEWFWENFMLLTDIQVRRYPVIVVTYERLLKESQEILKDLFPWLGAGDIAKTEGIIKPKLNTQKKEQIKVTTRFEAEFDEYYNLLNEKKPVPVAFYYKLLDVKREIWKECSDVLKRKRAYWDERVGVEDEVAEDGAQI